MNLIRTDHRAVPGPEQESAPAFPPLSTDFITNDARLKQSLECLPTYAKSDLPILLTGEPGTGKELVAEAICALSRPRRPTCQRLNCASLNESLACSELFGHLRGAFTDANRSRPGKFRLAHGGTLFLDEVGELPLGVQPKLLRAVEQGEIEPVGGDTAVKVNVRLIAATNQNLPQLVAQGRFRQDLLDRLAVLTINLPPLRERLDDVALLARHFAQEVGRRHGSRPARFSQAALQRLQQHSWPGNVRELKNVITRAVLFCTGGLIRGQDIAFTAHYSEPKFPLTPTGEFLTTRPTGSRLQELLEEERGNISALSRRLQVCTKTIYRWLRRYGIDLVSLRTAAV
jgi:DNA-binding NtrC family response regulator